MLPDMVVHRVGADPDQAESYRKWPYRAGVRIRDCESESILQCRLSNTGKTPAKLRPEARQRRLQCPGVQEKMSASLSGAKLQWFPVYRSRARWAALSSGGIQTISSN